VTISTDEAGFGQRAENHRRELHVHCYRMLASFHEADDAVQETFLRAWRHRSRFDEGDNFRAWLYRVATNVCLDMLRQRSRYQRKITSFPDVPWMTPYPDVLLDEVEDTPDVKAVDRETIELVFLAALQTLPPRQRTALIARDVLGWSANEAAELLETSVAAANSAVQRARATMREHLPPSRTEWTGTPNAEEREILARFIDAHQRLDAAEAIAVAGEDIRITMPPYPWLYEGFDQMIPLLERAFGESRDGDWRLVPTMANRLPAAACYLLRDGDTAFRAFKLDVLQIKNNKIVAITTFGPELFPAFDLPETVNG
jgi:RNA polymerase sigma-70 factor (TIGR02960 family)